MPDLIAFAFVGLFLRNINGRRVFNESCNMIYKVRGNQYTGKVSK